MTNLERKAFLGEKGRVWEEVWWGPDGEETYLGTLVFPLLGWMDWNVLIKQAFKGELDAKHHLKMNDRLRKAISRP